MQVPAYFLKYLILANPTIIYYKSPKTETISKIKNEATTPRISKYNLGETGPYRTLLSP